MQISGKVALITGGASGLGFATAKKLHENGAKIMLLDVNEENLKKAKESISKDVSSCLANVTEEDSVVKAIKDTVENFGSINISKLSS